MDQRHPETQPYERVRAPVGKPGWEGRRPLLWRLPLLAFLAAGLICLNYLDGRLSSDYRRSAADLAVQADALIESAVHNRASSLHSLRVLVADAASSPSGQQSRFNALARAMLESSPEILRIFRVDATGVVHQALPNVGSTDDLTSENQLLVAETRAALERSRVTRAPATTGVIVLRHDTLGFVLYDPIIVNDRLTGYVGAAVAYGPLLRGLLTPRLQGRFGYRIADSSGRLLAVSPRYPTRVAELSTQRVALPGGSHWQLAVPIGVFQPRSARVVMWIIGLVSLFVVFLLVLREDARAERIAMHSFNLELLSRDLLDANVRLEERAQQVTEANQAKSRFLANVSHELRTPLNAIVGYNSLALSGLYGEVTPDLRGAHDRIRAAADHLLHVVNDVLDLSKIEVGRMEVDRQPVMVEIMLEDIVALVEPVAEAKGVRLDLIVPRELPRVVTDPRHLRQIVTSLLTNAIKFTEQGSVTIVAKMSDAAAKVLSIVVEDTGIGIAPVDLARIFDEFEQVRPSGRGDSMARGTGLGLAVSRKLARLLGGDVRADSHLGAGSRFTLTLPIETAAVSAEPHGAPPAKDKEPPETAVSESTAQAAEHRS